jgi:hypothetical protein
MTENVNSFFCSREAVVSAVDTDLDESEKVFESEFHKLYGDKEDEDKAAEALDEAEKQVPEGSF